MPIHLIMIQLDHYLVSTNFVTVFFKIGISFLYGFKHLSVEILTLAS